MSSYPTLTALGKTSFFLAIIINFVFGQFTSIPIRVRVVKLVTRRIIHPILVARVWLPAGVSNKKTSGVPFVTMSRKVYFKNVKKKSYHLGYNFRTIIGVALTNL